MDVRTACGPLSILAAAFLACGSSGGRGGTDTAPSDLGPTADVPADVAGDAAAETAPDDEPEVAQEVAQEVAPEVAPEVAQEVGPEAVEPAPEVVEVAEETADPGQEAGEDAAPEPGQDAVGEDAPHAPHDAPHDAPPDAPADVPPDTPPAPCGNGVLDPGEKCEPGTDADCADAAPWTVPGFRIACTSACAWEDGKCLLRAPRMYFPLPGTNQSKCFDESAAIDCPGVGQPFFGQDASDPFPVPWWEILTDGGQTVIRDRHADVHWQVEVPQMPRTWAEASQYCADLDHGGFSDWRLPTLHELFTITDHGWSAPSVDPDLFPNAPSGNTWTATPAAAAPGQYWTVSFYAATPGAALADTPAFVRCARTAWPVEAGEGGPDLAGDGLRFESSEPQPGQAIVTDVISRIEWFVLASDVPDWKTWKAALAACQDSSWAERYDWHVPDAWEALSLISADLAGPASGFAIGFDSPFWTSTTSAASPEFALSMSPEIGTLSGMNKALTGPVACARKTVE
ncbi:MAG: DUF1566 domain-containing protein [Deltaproteobacteria bacterium]|nr:DUF1566 domain-containing protein [Deltaproteobacteria bacterium]